MPKGWLGQMAPPLMRLAACHPLARAGRPMMAALVRETMGLYREPAGVVRAAPAAVAPMVAQSLVGVTRVPAVVAPAAARRGAASAAAVKAARVAPIHFPLAAVPAELKTPRLRVVLARPRPASVGLAEAAVARPGLPFKRALRAETELSVKKSARHSALVAAAAVAVAGQASPREPMAETAGCMAEAEGAVVPAVVLAEMGLVAQPGVA